MSGTGPLVGVDARSVAGQPTGVGRYVRNLVGAMARSEAAPRLRLYLPRSMDADWGAGVEERVLGLPGALGGLDNAFTWNHVRLPAHLAREPVDLLHGPFYTLPAVCPCPAVVTIHDISFALHPEWFTRRARLAFGGFAASSARRARHVLTVSECSRRDIIDRFGVPASRVTAVHLAPDPGFTPVSDPDRIAAVRAKYGAPEGYILYVGSISPRRNIPRLLDAFARVARDRKDAFLLIAGSVEPPSPPVDPLIRARGLERRARCTGYVDGADLPALYSGASLVAYPSLYEGFGLPVVEAMACGVPVIASNTSCFPEVAGDAALLVDPHDTGALAEGIAALLSDARLRESLVARGLRRASEFSWDRAAEATIAVYRAALAGHEAEACR